MIASYHGHKEIVKILLENNADINIQDCFGKRAIDRSKDNMIIKMLQNEEEKLGSIMTVKSPKLAMRLSNSSFVSQNNMSQNINNNLNNTSNLNNLTNNVTLSNYQLNSNINIESNNLQNISTTSHKNGASNITSGLKKSNSKAILNTSVERKKSASPNQQIRFADTISTSITYNEKDKVLISIPFISKFINLGSNKHRNT